MTMINLTRTLVCLISKKGLPRMRRPCEQIARATLCAVALIAALSGCTDYSGYVFDTTDHQHNVELVDRLILDEDRDDHYNDSSKGMAFLNDTTLAVATERGSVLFVDVSDPTDLALIGRFDPSGPPNEAQHVFIVTMDGFAYVSFIARRSSKPDDIGLMVVDARQPAAPELAFELPIEEVYGAVVAAKTTISTFETSSAPSKSGMRQIRSAFLWQAPTHRRKAGFCPVLKTRSRVSHRLRPASWQLRRRSAPSWPTKTPNWLPPILVLVQASTALPSRMDSFICWSFKGAVIPPSAKMAGLWIIDVSSPEEPMPVAFLPASEFGVNFRHGYHDVWTGEIQPSLYGILAVPGYVYLTTALGTTNMAIVDVSEPASPVIFGWGNAPDTASTRAVEDGLAYVQELNYYANWRMGNVQPRICRFSMSPIRPSRS